MVTLSNSLTSVAPTQTKLGKFSDIAKESYVNSLLGNPSTPLVGITSNTVSALTAPIDTSFKVLTSVFNKPEERTTATEAFASWMGLADGVLKASQFTATRAANIFSNSTETVEDTMTRLGLPGEKLTKSNKIGLEQRSFTAEKLGLNPDSLTGKLADGFGAFQNTPGTVLNNIDVFYKIINANRALAERATRAVSLGQHPDFNTARQAILADDISSEAIAKNADYYTFMNKTSMGSLSWLTDKSVEKIPGFGFIIPFKRAVAATLEQTLERTPLRFMSPDLNRQFFSADPEVRATAQARFLTGTALMTSVGLLVKDHVNLEVPKKDGNWPSPADRALFESKFGPENSLVIDSDLYGKVAIPLDNIGPLGSMLKLIKGYETWWNNRNKGRLWDADDLDDEQAMLREASEFIEPVMQSLYDNYWGKQVIEFSGVLDQAISKKDPDRLLRFLERMGVKMIPGLVGSGYTQMVARVEDPYKKRIDETGDIFNATFKNTVGKVSNSYTWDGKPILASSYHNVGNHQLLTDVYKTEDPTRDFLLDLGVRIAAPAAYVESPPIGKTGVPGVKIKLTDEEWAQFHEYTLNGVPRHETANGTVIPPLRTVIDMHRNSTKFLEKTTKEEQAYLVQKAIPQIREAYKAHMMRPGTDLHKRYTEALKAKAEQVKQLHEQGVN